MTGRIETDALGSVTISDGALWGVHTQRAVENFRISGTTIGSHRALVKALGMVKVAAALTNRDLGLVPANVANAIVTAGQEVIAGDHDSQFVVDVIQGGAGTSANLNANEVIANRALAVLGHPAGCYDIVHPIEHVNRCQSTNDVYPTAVRLAILLELDTLLAALSSLETTFLDRGAAFADVPKMGRTQLQDAVPMTLGQEFTAFAVTIREDQERLVDAAQLMLECSIGATAIGTGITATPEYREQILPRLAEVSGLHLRPVRDFIEATSDTGAFVQFSGVLKRLATKLSKISSDLRLLASGPEVGLAEIVLPARQAGSSIMPGKVNPVIPEVMNQIAFFAFGSDLTVTFAAEHGQLQLNAFEPAIAHSILQSMLWLGNGATALATLCVAGITVGPALRAGRITNTALATELVPLLGYRQASELSAEATRTGQNVATLALARNLITAAQLRSAVPGVLQEPPRCSLA